MSPPVLFIPFNAELLRLIDLKEGLTADNYRRPARKRDELRDVVRADSDRRAAESRGGR